VLVTSDGSGDLAGSVHFSAFQEKPGSTLLYKVVLERVTVGCHRCQGVWDTSSSTPRSGPCTAPYCPSGHHFSGITCKNGYSFTHFFQKRPNRLIYGKRGIFRGAVKRFCTLLGGETQVRMGCRRGQMKGRAVLGVKPSQ